MADIKHKSSLPFVITREAYEDATIIMDDNADGSVSSEEFARNADLASGVFVDDLNDPTKEFLMSQEFNSEKFSFANYSLWRDFFEVRDEREILYVENDGMPLMVGAAEWNVSATHYVNYNDADGDDYSLWSGVIEAIGTGIMDPDGGPVARAEAMLDRGMSHDDVDKMLAKAVKNVNPQGLKNNCPSTAEATDRLLKGEIGVYASGEDLGSLPDEVGVSSEPVFTARDILAWIPRSGDTAKLLLMGEINHVVNVVNIRGVLHVVDGQKGTSMTFRGGVLNPNVMLRLIPTSW